MMQTRLRLMLMLCIAACFAGCSTQRVPSVTVLGAEVAGRSDEAMLLEIALEVANQSDVALRLDEFNYTVNIDGKPVYAGVRSAEATLASNDVRRMVIPAVVPLDQLEPSADETSLAAQYSVHGTLSYIAPDEIAKMFRDMGFPKPRATISGSGSTTPR